MTDNKSEPDKKAAAPSGPANRPHATLDLKATEVKQPEPAGKPATPETAAKDKSSAKAGSGPTPPKADAPEAPKVSASRPAAPAAPRGYGGLVTELAAGLVGGVIALSAADMLASQLGLEGPSARRDTLPALEQRLTALEVARTQRAPTPEINTRVAGVETRLKKLEQTEGSIDTLTKKQGELAQTLDAANEKLRTLGNDGNAQARIAKLEEQLTTMSAAAERDPQSGRLPQLAAITGKIADLESTLTNQLDALRKSVNQEIDTRLGAATEAGEAARSGTQRMDKDLSLLKAQDAQIVGDLDAAKADSARAVAGLKATQDELKKLKADLDARLAAFAKPDDVASAVGPISGKLTSLEQNLQSVLKSEGDRKTTAERIVLSLELANLKRAIDRGNAYAPELAQTRKLAGPSIDLSALERYATEGVPTQTELRADFKPVAFAIIDAGTEPAEGSLVDRFLAGAKSIVRVRKTSHSADDKSVEAIVARMEAALNEDRLGDVLNEARALPQPAQESARDFLSKVAARNAVDSAVASV
jgi:hypothetical protein